ncbi:phage tail tape measure protein [Kribbella sp. NPDC003505]|uniref:phage tail tape measure protein n=1 Tax=Kribbella sp. NPDC003505 TaxID=3154448 RepID=UPI0033AD7E8C
MAGPIRIAILGDGSKAKKEAKDTAAAYESSFAKIGDKVRLGVSKSFGGLRASASSGLGDLLGAVKGVPMLAAGAALGGGLIAGFTKALDLEDARGKLKAQLGLTGPESKKAGKIAGDLYKQAYGDSISDVNDVLKDVFQSGLASIGDSENKIQGVAQAAFTLSQVMGEETLPITRAVSQMLKTGLAKNSKEAFDVLTRGQQLGINKSEDLLDTFNEYGTQFRKLGLNAADALGLMNQLLQGGARDSDVAADAIKEFSIRAIDGSTATAQGFKLLGLNADDMAKKIAAGGPTARTAFGQVLTAVNSISDPVKRNAAGVALFGTQWEDLGAAVKNANLSTAAKSLGDLAGATSRANDDMTTTSTKLKQIGRTIQFSVVDAISKYALPKLNEFASWFQGPGKFVVLGWAIDAGGAILDFADALVGGLQVTLGGLVDFARHLIELRAEMLKFINPEQSKQLFEQAEALKTFGAASKGLDTAREKLQAWSQAAKAAKTKVEFTAKIDDLDKKITAARQMLKDPKLSATQRAKLEADISQLERNKTKAIAELGDPKLIATRTAKLNADKKSLDQKIAAAKAALNSKDLTRERRATLNATIKDLLKKKAEAQASINSLKGKVVPITVKLKYEGGALKGQPGSSDLGGLFPARASGGPVMARKTYLVGENGPELLTLGGMSGYITPNEKIAPSLLDSPVGGGAPVIVNVYALTSGPEVGRAAVEAIREYERFNGSGWRN